MFVPTITGIVGGYMLDESLGTKTMAVLPEETILGCIVAGLLIKQQLQKKI
jgi:hypothetical protein